MKTFRRQQGRDLHQVVGSLSRPKMKEAICQSAKTPLQLGTLNLSLIHFFLHFLPSQAFRFESEVSEGLVSDIRI